MLLASLAKDASSWGWFAGVGLVAVMGYYVRAGSGGQALAIVREANEVLAGKNGELTDLIGQQAGRIAELERTRTLEPIVAEVAGLAKSLETIIAVHEQRAQERHEGQLRALEAIAARMEGLSDAVDPVERRRP